MRSPAQGDILSQSLPLMHYSFFSLPTISSRYSKKSVVCLLGFVGSNVPNW